MDVADEQFWAIRQRLNYIVCIMAVILLFVALIAGIEFNRFYHEADRLSRSAIIEEGAQEKHLSGAKEEKGTSIPAGSIFSGTLLTGIDASCGLDVKKAPFPVLLRVRRVTILPNHQTVDVRKCFMLALGYSDMSTKRVYLQSERFSYIREDGKALETKVEMWAVGEDGKAGVCGRMVSSKDIMDPVVEIDAGREVNFILKSRVTLKLQGNI